MDFPEVQVINITAIRSSMPTLTLTTDWGRRDHYIASLKGKLLSTVPGLSVIDISHDVERFNIMQAAYIIQNAYLNFPKDTIHFIGVSLNDNSNVSNSYVAIKSNGHYLLGEDNGIFSLILGNSDKEVIRLPLNAHNSRSEIFSELIDTIKCISEGQFNDLGNLSTEIRESYFAQPTVDAETIRGTIIYIDDFGNAVVNITRELFLKEMMNRKFVIHLRKSTYDITTISRNYEDVEVGEIVALFNQDGYLEIALNKDSAGQLLGLRLMDPIRIEFNDTQAG